MRRVLRVSQHSTDAVFLRSYLVSHPASKLRHNALRCSNGAQSADLSSYSAHAYFGTKFSKVEKEIATDHRSPLHQHDLPPRIPLRPPRRSKSRCPMRKLPLPDYHWDQRFLLLKLHLLADRVEGADAARRWPSGQQSQAVQLP